MTKNIEEIERNPLLLALHNIADLGTCGGKGNFQKALNIAVSAICAAERSAIEQARQ